MHVQSEFNLCTEGMCAYKTDMLNVQLYLQGVHFLPRLHTDWYRVSQLSCVMCGIPLPSLCSGTVRDSSINIVGQIVIHH